MAEQLRVDRVIVEADAARISTAAGYFSGGSLSPVDGKSTITAKGNSIAAFNRGQTGIAALGTALDADVANIRSLGVKFEEFDTMMGELSRSDPNLTVSENSME